MSSPGLRRLLRWALGLTGGALVLTAVALFGAPRLLDLPSVKAQLERQLSRALQGEVAWDAIEVRVLPFPRGVVRGARIALPAAVSGRADLIELDLGLLALVRGRVEIKAVTVVRPVFKVQIAPSSAPAAAAPTDPISAYRHALQPSMDAVRRFAPQMTLAIGEGQVEIHAPGLPPIGATQMNLRADTDASGIAIKATAVGNYWEHLRLDARVEFADLRASATLDATGVKPQKVLDRMMIDIQPTIELPSVGIRAEARTDGRTSLDLALNLALPSTTLRLGDRRLEIVEVRLKGAVKVGAQDVELTLSDVHLGELLPAGRATLRLLGPQRQPQATIEVTALDLARLRVAALAIAGNQPLVQDYVARIRGGEVSDIRLSAKADTLASLFRLPSLAGSFTLKGGAVLAPVVEQELKDVGAKVELGDSKVKGREVTLQLGASRLSDGSLDYEIENGRVTSKIGFDLDLAQALDLTRRVLSQDQRGSLEMIKSLGGRARGSVTAALSGAQWSVDVGIARSDSALRLQNLPWQVSLREGRLAASPKRIAVNGLAGSVGASAFAHVSADVALGSPLRLNAAGGQVSLALDELYPWLQSQEALAKALKPIRAVAGITDVTLSNLSGRLDQAQALAYDVTVQPRRVRVDVTDLPGPVTIDGGAVRIMPDTVSLDRVEAGMLDAKARLSGSVGDYRSKHPNVDANISEGAVGEKLIEWIWRRADLPQRLVPVTPLQFAAQRVQWSDAGLNIAAGAQLASGQALGIDLGLQSGAIDIRRFTLKDRESDATMSFATRGRLLDVSFSGKLASHSVASMLKNATGEDPGRIYGDMRVTLDRDRQGRTSATGGLAGDHLNLGRVLPVPLKLERIDLEGEGAVLHVHELSVDWAEQKAVIRGEIARKSSGPVIQAEMDSVGIVIDALLPAGHKPEKPEGGQPKEETEPASAHETTPEALKLWPPPITGTLTLRAGYLEFHGLRVMPLRAALEVKPDRAEMRVTEAALCGIDLPFTASAVPGEVNVAVHMSAKNQQLEGVARCLTDQRVLITGRFDLAAELTARGKAAELLSSVDGPLEFHAHDGEIRKFALLGNILALKNVSGLFKKEVNLGGEGFSYRDIVVRGRFGNRKFAVEEGSLDSDALGVAASGSIDLSTERQTHLSVLVAPFTGLNRLVRKIPIIGYVLGGALTSIPVGVSGDIRDPRVVPLGPGAITSELVGIFERTLKLPGRLVEPVTGQPPAQ